MPSGNGSGIFHPQFGKTWSLLKWNPFPLLFFILFLTRHILNRSLLFSFHIWSASFWEVGSLDITNIPTVTIWVKMWKTVLNDLPIPATRKMVAGFLLTTYLVVLCLIDMIKKQWSPLPSANKSGHTEWFRLGNISDCMVEYQPLNGINQENISLQCENRLITQLNFHRDCYLKIKK